MSALREARLAAGLSQEELAERTGTSQPQINKLETGKRKMTLDWAVKLARPLGIDPISLMPEDRQDRSVSIVVGRSGFGDGGRPYMTPAPGGGALPAQMPVRAAARGGVDQEMFLEDGPIDWVAVPDYLKNARDPYGIWVVGESMMPRFRPAQVIHINPYKPPMPGAGVVLVKTSKAVLIKEFVRRTLDGGVVLREYRPQDREFTVPREEVDTLHTVVGLQEP